MFNDKSVFVKAIDEKSIENEARNQKTKETEKIEKENWERTKELNSFRKQREENLGS